MLLMSLLTLIFLLFLNYKCNRVDKYSVSNISKSNICKNYNHSSFLLCPVVAIILPVTSKGNKIDKNNPDPSQMLLMDYFYPTFLLTIEPTKYEYRIYLGYAYDDIYLSNSTFLSKLQKKMEKNQFFVFSYSF